MPEVDVNYLAIFVGAIIAMVIGSIWYSPLLFQKKWMKAIGKTKEQIAEEGNFVTSMLASFVFALLTSFILAHVVDYTEATTAALGAQTAFWMWLGFILPVSVANIVYDGKSKEAAAIYQSYMLVTLLITGAVLAVWV